MWSSPETECWSDGVRTVQRSATRPFSGERASERARRAPNHTTFSIHHYLPWVGYFEKKGEVHELRQLLRGEETGRLDPAVDRTGG